LSFVSLEATQYNFVDEINPVANITGMTEFAGLENDGVEQEQT